MQYAALATWVVAAVLGFVMLATWVSHGGSRGGEQSHFRPPVVYGHFTLAAAGLVIWLVYLVSDNTDLAWTAFAILIAVALIGDTLVLRWYKDRRTGGWGRTSFPGGPQGGSVTGRTPGDTITDPAAGRATLAEQHLSVALVALHGLFAVATIVLVLLTALGVGGS